MKATEKFKRTLAELQTDEYGDPIISPADGNDKNTSNVIKQGEKLKGWID